MRRTRLRAAIALLALAAAACAGDGAATTTTEAVTTTAAPSTTAATTTAATTTTSTTTLPPTTTTTTLPPPEVAWGEPQSLLVVPPSFFADRGDVIDAGVRLIASWGEAAYLFAGVDVVGRVHDLGGITQTDPYSGVGVWSSPDGTAWTEQIDLPFPGSFDEWAHGAVPFGEDLVVVGGWRESGTTPTQVQDMWTFPGDDLDGAAWVGSGAPPAWTQAEAAGLGGDREEEMRDVVAIGGLLVAVGSSDIMPEFGEAGRPEYAGAVWISADGVAWQRVEDSAPVFSGPGLTTALEAAVVDGTTAWAFGVAGGSGSDELAVWSTTDGTDWARLEITGDGLTSSQGLVVDDAALSGAGMVVVGNEVGSNGRFPALWFSPDGLSWERADTGVAGEGRLVAVAATEFGFVAVGFSQDEGGEVRPLVLLSGDGRTWHREAGTAFEVEGARRLTLTAVGTHQGLVIATGSVLYFDDYTEVVVWAGPVTSSGG